MSQGLSNYPKKEEVSIMTKRMNEIVKEYKEYAEMVEALKKEMDQLKEEAIEIMGEAHIDEFTCDEGKITYREVLTKRFASTEFKKLHLALYEAFLKQTSSMRFTCN